MQRPQGLVGLGFGIVAAAGAAFAWPTADLAERAIAGLGAVALLGGAVVVRRVVRAKRSSKAVARRTLRQRDLAQRLGEGRILLTRDCAEGDTSLEAEVGQWFTAVRETLRAIDPRLEEVFDETEGLPRDAVRSRSLPHGVGTALRNRLAKLEQILKTPT